MAGYRRFEDFHLSKKLQEAVKEAHFDRPTELQQEVIPLTLENKDVIFEARSGMGKSVCFGIPFLQHWLRDRNRRGLIITATEKGANQMFKVLSKLSTTLRGRMMKFIGQDDYFYPEYLAKTPIVILELAVAERFLRREKEYVKRTKLLGLDEFDKLLEREDQLGKVISYLNADRQTLICADELTETLLERGRWFCNPDRMAKVQTARPQTRWSGDEIKLQYAMVTENNQFDRLASLIAISPDSIVLVLTESDRVSSYIVDRLRGIRLGGELLAYSMQLNAKQEIVDKVTKAGCGVLVACEAAMNAVTVPKLGHLISWDLPAQIDAYWRRLDRFGYHKQIVATVLVSRSRRPAVRILASQAADEIVQVDPPKYVHEDTSAAPTDTGDGPEQGQCEVKGLGRS